MELSTSCIRHPSNSPFIIRRQYQVDACEIAESDDRDSTAETCAELLGIFEYHTNNSSANKVLNGLINNARKKHGKALKDNLNWLPYSYSYFRELLFYSRGQHQIINALNRLEEKGFLSSKVPNEISAFYSQNMKWYRLNVEGLNELADRVQGGEIFEGDVREVPAQSVPAKKGKNQEIENLVGQICEFHRHIHGKPPTYVYDIKRKKMVRVIYKQRKAIIGDERALAQCLMAIIANRLDDFYQGNHPKNDRLNGGKTFDSIEYPFREASAFERHLDIADSKAVTEEIALGEFRAFLKGDTSRYAKKAVNLAQKTQSDEIAVDQKETKAILLIYGTFARLVVQFFIEGKGANEILDACAMDDELDSFGKGLTDGEVLEAQILRAAKMFTEDLSERVKAEIKTFAFEYADNQQLNSEE